jgi:hypothetical protein
MRNADPSKLQRAQSAILPLFMAGDVGKSLTDEIRNPNLAAFAMLGRAREIPNNYESTKHEIQRRLSRLEHCGFEFVSDFSIPISDFPVGLGLARAHYRMVLVTLVQRVVRAFDEGLCPFD